VRGYAVAELLRMRDVPDEQRAIVELHIDELERTSEQLANIDKGSISESYLGSMITGANYRAGWVKQGRG